MKLRWPLPIDDKKYDWVLNTFDSEASDAELVPLGRDEPWETIATIATRRGADVLFGIFPALTQLRPRFVAATESVPIPSMSAPPAHARTLPSLLSQIPISGIVLPQRELAATVDILKDAQYRGYYQVLLGLDEAPTADFSHLDMLFEIHVVPGMVGLFQCGVRAALRTTFHQNRRFRWEFEDSAAFISDSSNSPRFLRMKFPQPVEFIPKPCACGEREQVRLI